MKEQYQKLIGKWDALKKRKSELDKKIIQGIIDCEHISQSLDVLFSFNGFMNQIVKNKLENITNAALKNIFPDKEMSFRVKANHTKRGVFYDLYIETNGVPTNLFDAKGGGVLDVVNMCLRITYIMKKKGLLRQVILMDEPFKNLDVERVTLASLWLKQVSETFGIQFLVVTHIPSLILSSNDTGNIEVRFVENKSVIVQ